MIPKPIDKIAAADFLALVGNKEEERRTREYKRTLPERSDKGKLEFLGDVSSLANTAGGDIIFGIDAPAGIPERLNGLADLNFDNAKLWLESVLRTGLDPRLPAVDIEKYSIPEKPPVVLLRVPKSWRAPHLVKHNDSFRMYGRTSSGKQPFDGTEIRSAYALSEQLPERIRRWRDDRLASILARETPVPLESAPLVVLHMIPIDSFSRGDQIPLAGLKRHVASFCPIASGGWSDRINLDGVVTFPGTLGRSPAHGSYCQAFRSGRVEAVFAGICAKPGDVAFVSLHETHLVQATTWYLKALKDLEVGLPIVLTMAISGAKGAIMPVGPEWGHREFTPIDRDPLILPDVMIEDYGADIPRALKPIFDAVWNACGFHGSINYDEKGNWAPDRRGR